MRKPLRSGQVLGRDGEVLQRARIDGSFVNEFEIPEHMRDPNWDLQWVRTSTIGKGDPSNVNMMMEQGWRPVTHKHYPNIFPDLKGQTHIERDGLMLMERPMSLTQQAIAEDRRSAIELRQVQAEAFGERPLPDGFDKGGRSRDGRFDASKKLRRTLEQTPRELKPTYEYATAGDDNDA